jgi:5-methylcytosine-specific restriction endonuclease McrA
MRVVRADPCAYCGRLPRKTLEPDTVTCAPLGTLDHIDPQSQRPRGLGGNHSWTNYAGACANCNQKKGSKSLLNFLAGRRGVRVPAESKDAGRRAA